MKNKKIATLILIVSFLTANAQKSISNDSLKSQSNWSLHGQMTAIGQKHSGFNAMYSGEKSLENGVEPTAISLTSTLFIGRKLWKNASFYVNPELSGGKGLSFAQGVAGALNGETYRVGEVEPQVFIARAYLQQHFALSNDPETEFLEEADNQVAGNVPAKRLTISVGKFAMSDFFDDNLYAKDPRTQFMNWSIWANAAWDYPANTRGYTFGGVAEVFFPKWEARLATVSVPRIANFHLMEYNSNAHSETFELVYKPLLWNKKTSIKFLASQTFSKAPSYQQGLEALVHGNSYILDVIRGNEENTQYGGKKIMFGLSMDHQITKNIGCFARLGWNDGKDASWAFTEIDNNISAGISVLGNDWNRKDDVVGLAIASNGISSPHQEFLKNGGYGFIIGDGHLNYQREDILEAYYSAKLSNFWSLSLDYQLVVNPAYNHDRGPVNAFALRSHFNF